MSELKTYDMEFDREETCPFCGRVYTGSDEEDYMQWWTPTECMHMCCTECAYWTEEYYCYLCPQCAKEEAQSDGKPI